MQRRRIHSRAPAGLNRLGRGGEVKRHNSVLSYEWQPRTPPPEPSLKLSRLCINRKQESGAGDRNGTQKGMGTLICVLPARSNAHGQAGFHMASTASISVVDANFSQIGKYRRYSFRNSHHQINNMQKKKWLSRRPIRKRNIYWAHARQVTKSTLFSLWLTIPKAVNV